MNTPIMYSVTEMSNPMKPEEPKKAYARIQHQKTLTLKELADHIVDHGSPFSSGSIQGILIDMTKCVGEALAEGSNVDLGDLGSLKTTISCEGAVAGQDAEGNPLTPSEMFSAANIKGLNVNFSQSDELMKALAKATFDVTITRAAQKAALRAQKKGEKSASWEKAEDEDDGEGDGTEG